ncbi:hypothetical protein [Aquabacterium sp.]|uniref:hypothetical protein n=1 Tax=Aquabacterium sp. TaxID=1872578 RepID=UPI002CC715E0|nr:hypothetical protein [Aquabacterium sp.]HSW04304.1 hypothetical protein [Aquabacterium sp.]
MRGRVKPSLCTLAALRAEWTVHYLHSVGERWMLDLGPRYDAQHVLAQRRGSCPRDVDVRTLLLKHDASRSPALEVIEAVALMHFGSAKLAPRIIGAPDWHEIALTSYADKGHGYEALLSLNVWVRGDTLVAVLREPGRHDHAEHALCGGDADPLYALLRVAGMGEQGSQAPLRLTPAVQPATHQSQGAP